MHSTTAPVRHSGGEHQRKCLQNNYTQVHDTVLRRRVESALTTVVGMQNRWATSVSAVRGHVHGIVDQAVSGVVEKVRATIIREKQSRIAQQ